MSRPADPGMVAAARQTSCRPLLDCERGPYSALGKPCRLVTMRDGFPMDSIAKQVIPAVYRWSASASALVLDTGSVFLSKGYRLDSELLGQTDG
jgi:hypothetical protein